MNGNTSLHVRIVALLLLLLLHAAASAPCTPSKQKFSSRRANACAGVGHELTEVTWW